MIVILAALNSSLKRPVSVFSKRGRVVRSTPVLWRGDSEKIGFMSNLYAN